VLAQLLNGLASASSLFLLSLGLTLIFGVSRVVNFAHGSLAMLGLYLGVTLAQALIPLWGALGFWGAVAGAALAVAAVGALIERGVLRRLYGSPDLRAGTDHPRCDAGRLGRRRSARAQGAGADRRAGARHAEPAVV